MNLSELSASLDVDLANLDVALLPKEVAPVALEIKGRIAATNGKVDEDGVGPLASRIVGPDIEMPTRWEERRDHVEASLMATDGGGIDTAIGPTQLRIRLSVEPRQVELRATRQTVAHLLPMHQILAMEHGYTGEVLERGIYQIKIIATTAHTGVGMEARQDGILETLRPNHIEAEKKERKVINELFNHDLHYIS